ncbi:MAG: MFS transporter [Ruminiclostridium sp.]|nr:MFS transporter [Ruminiclostridium sp.]
MKSLKKYCLLWATQSLSGLGSAMTSYSLVIWLYQRSGSALQSALLSVCTYAPYVLMSIFAGAFSDRWNKKKTMLVCDSIAAFTTVILLVLAKADMLGAWHLYLLNALNGLMNTVQQPASEVATTLLIPEEYYQKTSGLRSLSRSLNSILTPIIATALFTFAGLEAVITVDLATFAVAFVTLAFFIRIPEMSRSGEKKEKLIKSAKAGLVWLKEHTLILKLILFLSGINLVASAYNAALPALILEKPNGGESVLGIVNAFAGIATVAGSLAVTVLPVPRDRVRMICLSLFFAMSMENFILAFCDSSVLWCIGAVLGWITIPYMGANLDVIFRTEIPADMQGRVFSCRNTLQFFLIPVGYLLGGYLTDSVFEPLALSLSDDSPLTSVFGNTGGSGAAMLFAVLGVTGVVICTVFTLMLRKYRWSEKR